MSVLRLKPFQFVHVHDSNTNVPRVLLGPLTYTCQGHEQPLQPEPQPCIAVPPAHFCVVANPVERNKDGSLATLPGGFVKLRTGDTEIRFEQEPFPLYPGEVLKEAVRPLESFGPLQALRLAALRDFTDDFTGKKYVAGEEWMVQGPLTYEPRREVQIVERLDAKVIDASTAVKLRAEAAFTDRTGTERIPGEEWLYDVPGAFIPAVEERVVSVVEAVTLTETRAVHVTALAGFTDRFGKSRQAGEEWLVTAEQCSTFLPTPNEAIKTLATLKIVGPRQYCVVVDYVDKEGIQHFGRSELRKGITTFFLHPGESLKGGSIEDVHILQADEALVLRADEHTVLADGTVQEAGSQWMVHGPRDFLPPVTVSVVTKRQAIPLDKNEGVYIRDRNTGLVRAHMGSTVMLSVDEELWEKPVSPLVEELLTIPRLTKNLAHLEAGSLPGDPTKPTTVPKKRNPYDVVTCNIPHNHVVQVYDFKREKARVVVGPALVTLEPDEEFTVASLSAGKPKAENMIKSLAVSLGPDFMTDVLLVETKDHARLQLHLSFNWEFDRTAPNYRERVFNVPDFVGDACKAIASRIRGAVAAESFDQFHRNSTTIIRRSVFGRAEDIVPLVNPSNGFKVTGVDIHSVDPVDPKTRVALQKSVQLAIEITTKGQEAAARHLATSKEQQARGRLGRQVIQDDAKAEEIRKALLECQATNNAIESTGSSNAQAKATAEGKRIEGESDCRSAKLRAEAETVMSSAEVEVLRRQQEAELAHLSAIAQMDADRDAKLAAIEAQKFNRTVSAIGKETIVSLAKAGPQLQSRLLGALGLQGYLVTDGTNPINLFNTAKGMTDQATAAVSRP